MDLQDFWQENKRWLLGVVAGLVVVWIGMGIVQAVFGGGAALRSAEAQARQLSTMKVYDSEALRAAREQNQRLVGLDQRLREHVAFEPGERFVLAGKGDPDVYFPGVERAVRSSVVDRAREAGVELDERNLSWPTPIGREEIEARLVELAVLEHAALRLLDAGERQRQDSPDALGVQGIDALKVELRSSAPARRRGPQAGADAAERISEARVKFAFRADIGTLQTWLQRLREESPPIGLAPDLRVLPGDQIGDPVTVTGTLAALRIREVPSDG